MRTLTHRVLCLSAVAAAVVIAKYVIFFLSERNVLEEFHESQFAQEDKTAFLEKPYSKVLVGALALVLALMVPCCGFLGAKTNNRPCICCFACCNCWGGCLHILQAILIILLMVGLGSVETVCRQPGSCEGIMKACKYHKSELYALDTYEGCLDYLVSMFPAAYAGLGIVLGLTSLAICFQCASARWGKELYDVLAYEDLCMDSDSDGV
eukprot:Skav207239  [mRNA]  locus=scaffold523:275736:278014:- [translate_table: standard]